MRYAWLVFCVLLGVANICEAGLFRNRRGSCANGSCGNSAAPSAQAALPQPVNPPDMKAPAPQPKLIIPVLLDSPELATVPPVKSPPANITVVEGWLQSNVTGQWHKVRFAVPQ